MILINTAPWILEKQVVCAPTDAIFQNLRQQWGETPAWTGIEPDDGIRYVLTENVTTATWTLLEFNDEVACIIGSGRKSRILTYQQRTKI